MHFRVHGAELEETDEHCEGSERKFNVERDLSFSIWRGVVLSTISYFLLNHVPEVDWEESGVGEVSEKDDEAQSEGEIEKVCDVVVGFSQTGVVLDEDLNDIYGHESHIINELGTIVYGVGRIK